MPHPDLLSDLHSRQVQVLRFFPDTGRSLTLAHQAVSLRRAPGPNGGQVQDGARSNLGIFDRRFILPISQ